MTKQRLLTALILLAILIPIITIPELLGVFEGVMILFVFFASREFIHMFEKKEQLTNVFKYVTHALTLFIYISIAGFLGFNQSSGYFDSTLLSVTLPFAVVIMLMYFVLSTKFKVELIGSALLVIVYIGFGAAAITLLKFLGTRFIFYMALISTMTDTFALLFGLRFGKHQLAPNVSPKKTWEGAIGGSVFATIIASGFASFYGTLFNPETFLGSIFNADGFQTIFDEVLPSDISIGFTYVIVLSLSFTASIVSQFGDLFASKLKRHYDIKDFGNIFPGHGGIMDRFDSMIMVSLYMSGILFMLNIIL